MDLWVVAALTGAGYAAKYMQNFSREKEGVPWQKSPYTTTSSEINGGNFSLVDGFGESMQRNSPIASTSGFQDDVSDSYNEGSQPSPRSLATLRGNTRGQNLLRTKHNQMQYLRPLNSLESCLMAQICKQHSQTPLQPPYVPPLRPFVVTDGTRVISRPSFDPCIAQVRDDTISEIDESICDGIPQLPERGSQEPCKDHAVQRLSSIREMPDRMQKSLQEPPCRAAFFCLGVSVGVMYSNLANKREVIKLKDVLKQTENLVQDLEEEIEMKDSLTVNELVNVGGVFPYEHDTSIDNNKPTVSHFQLDSQITVDYGAGNSYHHKAPEKSESMNQIEAELEAELERLELNMKVSTLQMKSSDYDDDDDGVNQLDTVLVAEMIQGELRPDNLSLKPSSDPSSSSSTSPSCTPKQWVSPRDLRIRLHQVIQSRLEWRVMELERALEKSQKRVRHLEHSDVSSSFLSHSYANSPPITDSVQAERQLPLVMNLSGEALEAYNEAFEELSKISGSELGTVLVDDDDTCMTAFEKREMISFDEDGDENDDTELLIRQIVEKTRQGSSAILNAHRAMISLDS